MTIEAAVREARARRHAYVTVEHLLLALAHEDAGAHLLQHAGADVPALAKDLERYLDEEIEKFDEGDAARLTQTLAFQRVLETTLTRATVTGDGDGSANEVTARDLLLAIFNEPDSHAMALLRAQGVSREHLVAYLKDGVSRGRGRGAQGEDARPVGAEGGEARMPDDPLAAFTTNLSEAAAAGKLDPLIGRALELERAVHVLARRRKNNPIFVGESGVGKTALAEGLAQRVHEGRIPESLRGAEIFSVDLGAMLAGARYRGDFEERFKAMVAAVQERENPIVFIDEIHTVLGAGAAQGATVDAANMLKPLLQSGELRCIGSTTYREYRHFERDRALARRFQRIDVPEPSVPEAQRIIAGLASRYEAHHGVRFTKPALRACVELSAKHLTERFLPDKAIDVMDEAGAAVRLRPGRVRKTVGLRDVENLIARMTGAPPATASQDDRTRLAALASDLRAVVFGQDDAVATVVRAVKRARAGLAGAAKPLGSFLFMGPTGVGKTELARQLAKTLDVPFLRFDMSEYMERHSVARLIGAPPGYVGYDEGGQLAERIRKQPHAVLLLDEIEKAHRDLYDILLQVMDRAALTDSHGREVDFRHVVLIMTSNVGSREIAKRAIGFAQNKKGARAELERVFSPEFRNRLDEVVRFEPLPRAVMERVVDKFVAELSEQLRERRVTLELSPAAKSWLARRGYSEEFGARPLARLLQSEVRDRLSDALLFGALQKGGAAKITVTTDGNALAVTVQEDAALNANPA